MAVFRSSPLTVFAISALLSLMFATTADAQQLQGRVVGITDGDTFTLLTNKKEQVRIRVAEIDAPETGQPYGNQSKQALSELIFNMEVTVDIQVVDRYGRPVGRPIVGNKDATEEMVRMGAAWVYRTYSDDAALYEIEREAKAQQRGLWGISEYAQIPPWDWRKGKRSVASSPGNAEAFKCGAKTYCKEMVSCNEAKYHLKQCGLTRLDGDGDGIPCEAVCR